MKSNMTRLVLLGDSIFDNAVYVAGGPAGIDQVRQNLPTGWQASLLAVDGDTSTDAPQQIQGLPSDATHLVLSVGGNDARNCLPQLDAPATSAKRYRCRANLAARTRYPVRSGSGDLRQGDPGRTHQGLQAGPGKVRPTPRCSGEADSGSVGA